MFKSFRKWFLLFGVIAIVAVFQNCGSGGGQNNGTGPKPTVNGFDYDLDGPVVAVSKSPAAYTNQKTAHFEVTAADGNGIGVDFIEYNADDSLQWTKVQSIVDLANLTPGFHKIIFHAFDFKGNKGEDVTKTWIVDTLPPTVSIAKSAKALPVHSAELLITTGDDHANNDSPVTLKKCLLDQAPQTCKATLDFDNLANGVHELQVTVADFAGNQTTATYTWQVTDTPAVIAAPEFETAPPEGGMSNASKVSIKLRALTGNGYSTVCAWSNPGIGGGADHTVTCPIAAALVLDVSEQVVNGKLAAYTFKAVTKKGADSSPVAKRSWFIDQTAPTIDFTSRPADPSPDNTVSIVFTTDDKSGSGVASISCFLDNATTSKNCVNGTGVTLNNLSSGAHHLVIVVTDKAGNSHSETVAWHNPSCKAEDLSMRWPINGKEGSDWAIIELYDEIRGSGQKDYTGATGDKARVSDDMNAIIVTSGDAHTLVSESSKVYAADSGVIKNIQVFANNDTSVLGVDKCKVADANEVKILHPNGFVSVYRNLQGIPSTLKIGDAIAKGTFLGRMGFTGCVKTPRLTFALLNCPRAYVEPMDAGRFAAAVRKDFDGFRILGPAIYTGALSLEKNLDQLVIHPATPTASFKVNGVYTLAGVIEGGIPGQKLVVTVADPSGKQTSVLNLNRPNGAGFWFAANSIKFAKEGKWTWTVYQETIVGNKTTAVAIYTKTVQVNK